MLLLLSIIIFLIKHHLPDDIFVNKVTFVSKIMFLFSEIIVVGGHCNTLQRTLQHTATHIFVLEDHFCHWRDFHSMIRQ